MIQDMLLTEDEMGRLSHRILLLLSYFLYVSVLSYLSPPLLVIPVANEIKILSLSTDAVTSNIKQFRSSLDRIDYPVIHSIPLRSPVSLLHRHQDGRIVTLSHKEKVLRFHSPYQSSHSSILHIRADKATHSSYRINCLSSLDSNRLLVGSSDGILSLYNTRSLTRMFTMKLDDSEIISMIAINHSTISESSILSSIISSPASSPSSSSSSSSSLSKHIITFSANHVFRLIDLAHQRIRRYLGHIDYVNRVSPLDADGRVCVSGEGDLMIWRLDKWHCERILNKEVEIEEEEKHRKHEKQLYQQEVKESSNHEEDSQESKYSSHLLTGIPDKSRHSSCVSPLWQSDYLAVGVNNGWMHIWRVTGSQRLMASTRAHQDSITCLTYIGEGKIVTCGAEGSLKIWYIDRDNRPEEEEMSPRYADGWHIHLLYVYLIGPATFPGRVLYLPGD